MIDKFPKGVRLIIDVVFPGEYRIGWKHEGKIYLPGSGSYYYFDTAILKAWEAFERCRLRDETKPMVDLISTPEAALLKGTKTKDKMFYADNCDLNDIEANLLSKYFGGERGVIAPALIDHMEILDLIDIFQLGRQGLHELMLSICDKGHACIIEESEEFPGGAKESSFTYRLLPYKW